jgi:hypothetical protein
MSGELERRLERLLREPRSSGEVERHALDLALAALPAAVPGGAEGRRRVLLVALTATLGVLGAAAAALAAAGALHLSVGTAPPPTPATPSELLVPAGAHAVAAVVDGRLWLTTRSGLRIQGLPVHSATLSPHALYVAAGIGDSLVAMAPSGTRAWSHPVGGPVVAIAWAPDGLRIEGNGIGDHLLDARVRPVSPSWRADSLAVAYVGAGGRAVVYDFAHDAHRLAGTAPATHIAFAPQGSTLAVATAYGVFLAGRTPRLVAHDSGAGFDVAWSGGRLVVASRTGSRSSLRLFRLTSEGRTVPAGRLALTGSVGALDGGTGGIVAAVARPRSATRLLAAASLQKVLLELPAGSTIDAVSIR